MEIPNSKFSLSHEALRAGGQIPNKFEVRNWKLSLFIFLFLLFTIYCSLFTRSVSAQQKNCSQFASASCKEYLSGCSGTWAQDAYGYNPADCVNLTNSTSRLYYCCITDPPQSCLNSSGRSCETDCPAACIVNPSSANGWWDCSQSCCNYSCCQTQGGCGATVYCNGAGGTSTAPSSNLPGTCIPSGNSCSGSKIPGAGCRTGYACCMPNNPTATPDPSIPWPTSIPVISPPAGQIAIPPPVVSCGGIAGLNNLGDANNEFHSLRPYQSSVCRSGITNTSLLCGNDLIGVDHTLEVGVDDAGKYLNGAQLGECRYSSSAGPTCGGQPNGSCTPDAGWDGYFDCDFGITLFKRISMAYPDAELPFLGYTQKLPNSQQNTANMGDATKMNEYVSWYLNGTNDRPEATSAVAAATCIGNAIGNYYSEVVDQLPSLSHVKLLSPAFNMTSNLSPTIFTTFYDTIGSHHIDGFAGNLYHAGGKSAVDYYRETWIPLLGNGHLYITEFGNHDSPQDTSPIIGEYTQLAGYGAIQSINLFNALGTHPGFSDFQLSTQKIGDVTGPNRGKGGINSAMPVTYGFADQVNDLGLNPKLTWATQIVSSPSQRGDVASAVNHSNDLNITEILRLCAGNSCDFENPQTLADFIKYLDGHVGGTVYIIVGPNEPDVEGWASKSCGTAENLSIVDTAGPVKKLLPWSIQARERIKTIMEAPDTTACYCTNVGIIPGTCQGNCTSGTGGTLNKSCTDDTKCVANAGGAIRHDQIVGCTSTLKSPIASSIFSINTGVITPCYEDSGGLLADLFTGRQAFRLSQWRGHLPPLEDQYSSFTDYWKAYEEWRGNMCTPTISIGGKDFYVCGDVDPTGGVLSPKYWGTLFQYIPFTSTEDRQGRVYTKAGAVTPPEGYTDQEPGSNVVEVSFKPINQTDLLFFPHTEESLKLGQMLQTTYVPYEWYHSAPPEVTEPQQAPVDSPSSLEYYNTDRCELRDVRTNPGDPLFARQSNTGGLTNVTGDLRFQVRFSCHLRNHYIPSSCYDPCYAQCEQNCIDNHCYNGGVCSSQSDSPACLNCTDVYCPNHCTDHCTSQCEQSDTCHVYYNVATSSWTQMPLIDNIYETLVDSPNSIFHHMYPAEALVGYQMLDIPAVTQGNYSQGYDEGGGGRQPDCIILCDDPNGGCTNVCNWNFDYIYSGALNSCKPGTQAEVYFPHLGSIKEYFLDGIQQVLRPLGFGTGALPVATEENDVAQPRPANVDATCAWDGFGCHYFTCQCVGVPGDPDQYGWDAVNSVCHGIWQLPQNTGPGTFYCPGVGEPPTASPTPSPAPGATPGPSPAPGFDQCTGIGCGTDKAPICESGRCNPYEIRPRKDYCTQCGGHYPDCNWPFSADECTELCHKEVYTKNNEGGYGSCHYENAAVCRRNDGQGGCAGVCNWLCCS